MIAAVTCSWCETSVDVGEIVRDASPDIAVLTPYSGVGSFRSGDGESRVEWNTGV